MRNRTVSVRLAADVSQYVTNIGRNAVKATKDLNTELAMLGKDHKEKFNQLATAAGGVGLALAGGFLATVKTAADFDRAMSSVAAVSNASGMRMDQLRQAAIDAGNATAYTATQAAQAEEELAKAGISTADILGGALKGSLDLAAAGQMDLADAATISAQAMNVFHLAGRDVPHIADVLAASANKSAADMHGLGLSLRQGGLVASQFGLTLEDTVGTLSAFADRALIGSDAGTSLKTMLLALANPSKEAAALMTQLGLKFYDAQGTFVGITGVADQLQRQLGGLTQAERDHALAQIFGSDAMRAANVLYTQGAAGLKDYISAVDDTGAASDTAAKKMDNLAGDVEKLRGTLETMAITSGSGAASGLRKLTQMADGVAHSLASVPPEVQSFGAIVAGIGGASLLAGTGVAKLSQKSTELQDTLRGMGPMGGRAAGGLNLLTGAAGRLAIALAAAQVASAAFGSDASGNLKQTVKSMTQFGNDSHVMLDRLNDDLETIKRGGMAGFGNKLGSTIEGLTGAGSLFDDSIEHAHQRLAGYDGALTAMVSAGHAEDAAKAFDRISEAAREQGVSVDDLERAFPQYQAAIDGSTATQQQNVKVTADQRHGFDLLHGSLSQAIDDVGSLKNAYDTLNGKAIDAAGAQINLTQAVDGLDKSMKENGSSFDAANVKGAANLEMYLRGAQAARDDAQAIYDLTGSVDKANAKFQEDINKVDAMARSHGAAASKVKELHDQYAQLPPLVQTQVTAPGLANADWQAMSFRDKLDALNNRHIQTYIDVQVRNFTASSLSGHGGQGLGGALNRWGGVYTHAAEGTLRQASVYSTASPARYAFAEPSTGGEAFVPRFGDYARSTAIVDTAARWYGGRFTPAGAGAGGYADNRTVTYVINDATDPKRVVAAIKKYEESNGAIWRR